MFHFQPAAPPADYGTPKLWNVCFCGTARNRFVDNFLAPGFRHVFLVGYVAEFSLWLRYEVLFAYSTVAIVSQDHAAGLIGAALREGDVLTMRPQFHMKHPFWSRFGFWCVPAVKHVLGVRCVAITPSGLHRCLLKMGAKPLKATRDEPVQRAEDQTGQGSTGGCCAAV